MSRDTMRDPRFAQILFVIEGKLNETDRLAASRSLTLTDSNIRSLLVRSINEAKGKTVKADASTASDKDRFLAEAQQQLTKVRGGIIEEWQHPDGTLQEKPLPAADWITSLEAIKQSCEIRTGQEPGSRGYLEYLKGFIQQAGKAK